MPSGHILHVGVWAASVSALDCGLCDHRHMSVLSSPCVLNPCHVGRCSPNVWWTHKSICRGTDGSIGLDGGGLRPCPPPCPLLGLQGPISTRDAVTAPAESAAGLHLSTASWDLACMAETKLYNSADRPCPLVPQALLKALMVTQMEKCVGRTQTFAGSAPSAHKRAAKQTSFPERKVLVCFSAPFFTASQVDMGVASAGCRPGGHDTLSGKQPIGDLWRPLPGPSWSPSETSAWRT